MSTMTSSSLSTRLPFLVFGIMPVLVATLMLQSGPALGDEAAQEFAVHGNLPLAKLSLPPRGKGRLSFVDGEGRLIAIQDLVDLGEEGVSFDDTAVTVGRRVRNAVFGVKLKGGAIPLALNLDRKGRRDAPSNVRIEVPPQWLIQANESTSPTTHSETDRSTDALALAIHEWVMANPDVIRASLDPNREAFAKAQEMRAEILASGAPRLHAGAGEVTIVAFGDYLCGYTQQAFPSVQAAIQSGASVQVQELAILGPDSEALAKRALAADAFGLYAQAHELLMVGGGGNLSDDEFAKAIGAHPAKFSDALASTEVVEAYDRSRNLAATVGINFTPVFLIYGPNGFQMSPGYIDPSSMMEMVESVR